VIQAPCNSSGSKGELGISSQFGFNFDFVAQPASDSDAEERSRSTTTSIAKEGSSTTAAGLDCANHTQELAQANHGASKRQSAKRIAQAHLFV